MVNHYNVKSIEPSAELLPGECDTNEDGIKLLQKIETIGRMSHRTEERQTDESYKRFIPAWVIEHGDWSLAEHVHLTAVMITDRGVHTEIIRHRLGFYYDPIGAYTAESTRFVNYTKRDDIGLTFIQNEDPSIMFASAWERVMHVAEEEYFNCVHNGVNPQVARDLLPLAKSVKMAVTYNLRQWRHFFLMRTSREVLPALRKVVDPLLQQFQERIPYLFADIFPGDSQRDNMKKMH